MKLRKWTCFCITVIMLLGLIPISSFADEGYTNVAFNQTVTASSIYNEFYTPDKMVDGDDVSEPGRWNSQPTKGLEWVLLDLGSEQMIQSVKMTWWDWMNLAGKINVSVSVDGETYREVGKIEGNFQVAYNEFVFEATKARYVKIELDQCPGDFGYSIKELTVMGSAVGAPTNVAYGKTATASSFYNEFYTPDKLVDGKSTADNERWNSQATKGQEWILVDLEAIYSIQSVKMTWLSWGNLAGKINVSVSADGEAYREVGKVEGNFEVAENTFTFDPVNARYVKIELDECASDWGYSIWEVMVMGKEACTHADSEVKDAKDATCSEEGYTGDTYCKDCGEQVSAGEEIAVKDHSYEGEKCSVCGAANPDYEAPVTSPATGDATVWMIAVSAAVLAALAIAISKKRAIAC